MAAAQRRDAARAACGLVVGGRRGVAAAAVVLVCMYCIIERRSVAAFQPVLRLYILYRGDAAGLPRWLLEKWCRWHQAHLSCGLHLSRTVISKPAAPPGQHQEVSQLSKV
jgi:hypothetical protein